MVKCTDRPTMTMAVDLGRKATKQTNKQTILLMSLEENSSYNYFLIMEFTFNWKDENNFCKSVFGSHSEWSLV